MGISAEVALSAANAYTVATVEGAGAIKGKNCTILSIADITGGHRVTFQWTLDNGTVQTDTMDVMDGVNGTNGKDGKDGIDGSQVSVTQVVSSGTKIATVTVDNVGTDLYAPAGGGVNYSTTEQNTGLKWIDGKDIYQCTFTGQYSDTLDVTTRTETNILGVDKVCHIAFETYYDGEGYDWMQQNTFVNNGISAVTKVWPGITQDSDRQLVIAAYNSLAILAGHDWIITVQYTKATT